MSSTQLDGVSAGQPEGLPLLGALLVERELVTQEQLEEALAVQHQTGKLLGEILVTNGAVSKLALANALAQQYGVELEEERGYGNGLLGEIERRTSAAARAVEEPPPAREPEPAGAEHDAYELQLDGLLPEFEPEELLQSPPEPESLPDLAYLDAALADRERALASLDERVEAARRRLSDLERTLTELEQSAAANLEVDYGLAHFFPEAAARANRALPIRYENGVVVVAVADPDDDAAIAEVEQLVARDVRFVRASEDVLLRAIETAYAATPAAR